jgi:hypothetical protein
MKAKLLILGGALLLGSSGLALADCSEAESSNPNIVFQDGGTRTDTQVGEVTYIGDGNVGKADVTTTTYQVCLAFNTQSNTLVPGQDQEIVLSTSTSNEVVCNPGAAHPDCPLP